ncbi:MAG: LacI family DNA-binding transcriptional regulator [Paracoccus sp. (in: a-proteobacteria)]
MVTLKDIGQRLGISPAQVSRALGGYSDVSEQTRLRVEEAARLLGYRPNPNALRLRSGRSGVVGLVVPENSEQEESNILLEILLGLAVEFWKRDVLVVLNVMPRAAPSTESYTRLFRQGAVDGFVVVNPSADPGALAFLTQQNIPFVTHGRAGVAPDHAYVDLDNRAVGRSVAVRLAGLGHRDIAPSTAPRTAFPPRNASVACPRCWPRKAGAARRPDPAWHDDRTPGEVRAGAVRRPRAGADRDHGREPRPCDGGAAGAAPAGPVGARRCVGHGP